MDHRCQSTQVSDETPTRVKLRQVANAVLVAALVGALSRIIRPDYAESPLDTDFDHLYAAAKAMLSGLDPYAIVGPGLPIAWPYRLFYPLPALLLVAPFTALPQLLANSVFVGSGAGAFWYFAQRSGVAYWPIFLSAAFFFCAQLGQWNLWYMAAALAPGALGVLLFAKPTIGVAAWAYRLRGSSLAIGLTVVLVSVVLVPQWPLRWLTASRGGLHPIPLFQPGGILLLLALTRWRRAEGRLLAVLALVPQTLTSHEMLTLFLVCRRQREAAILALLTWAAFFSVKFLKLGDAVGSFQTGGQQYISEMLAVSAPVHVALVYLPTLVFLLRRPNEGEVPVWADRLVAPVAERAAAYLGPLSRRLGL